MKILSLGAGVQSSVLLLMADEGHFGDVKYAVFSDTGNEPKHVYKWLQYLKTLVKNIEIIETSKGNIIEDTLNGLKEGKRFATAPFFTRDPETNEKGIVRRQCTTEYKIMAVRKKCRELMQKHEEKTIELLMGISTDEITRIKPSQVKYITHQYPLIDLDMSRNDCLNYFADKGLPLPPKSSCIMCPYHSDEFWLEIKKNTPDEFEWACQFDEQIRNHPKLKSQLFLHRSATPLRTVDLKENQVTMWDYFDEECEGMCGI